MKKDLNIPLTELDGSIVKRDDKPVTVKQIIVEALMANVANDKSTGEQKFKRFLIATKISADEISVDLTPEEIVTIKEYVGISFSPLVVGQIFTLLNA